MVEGRPMDLLLVERIGPVARSGRWRPAAARARSCHLRLASRPRESPDGRSIYFIDRPQVSLRSGACRHTQTRLVDGGPAESGGRPVMPGAWDVTDAGIVFVFVRGPVPMDHFARAPDVLQMYDFADRRIRTLGSWHSVSGLTARTASSPCRAMVDGRWPATSTAGSATSSSSTGSGNGLRRWRPASVGPQR